MILELNYFWSLQQLKSHQMIQKVKFSLLILMEALLRVSSRPNIDHFFVLVRSNRLRIFSQCNNMYRIYSIKRFRIFLLHIWGRRLFETRALQCKWGDNFSPVMKIYVDFYVVWDQWNSKYNINNWGFKYQDSLTVLKILVKVAYMFESGSSSEL